MTSQLVWKTMQLSVMWKPEIQNIVCPAIKLKEKKYLQIHRYGFLNEGEGVDGI